MRTKFAADFPQYDVAIFNAQYYGDRKRADGSGRQTRYSFDERRYMAEKATWQNFCMSFTHDQRHGVALIE